MDDPNELPEPEPLEKKKFHFKCNLCPYETSAYFESNLEQLQHMHMRDHRQISSSYGITANYNSLVLTEYDIRFLKGCRISYE